MKLVCNHEINDNDGPATYMGDGSPLYLCYICRDYIKKDKEIIKSRKIKTTEPETELNLLFKEE